MEKIALSIVVMTKNEEKNIEECLKSVKDWAGEIVVVDDYSSDATLDIVRKYTDRIYQRKWDMEGASRNFAYSKAAYDYVLSLDADERVTAELKDEIIGIFQKKLLFDGYNIPHRNYLGNYWIRHGGWYPNAKLKMFRKDKFRCEESEFHPRAFLEGPTYTLEKDIIHYNYPDFHSLFAKINHQTDFEAKKWVRDKRRMNKFICLWKIIERFFKFYFLKRGYLDGFIGFFLAVYSGMYQFYTYCKYREIKNRSRDSRGVVY